MAARTECTDHLLDLVLVVIAPLLQVHPASLQTLIAGVLHAATSTCALCFELR